MWLLVQSRRLGMSDAELLASYPTLRAEDLASAWQYAASHATEINQQIAVNEGA